MQTDILIARTDEALAVFTDYPAQGRWPSLQLKGLDNVKLAALLEAFG